MADNDEKEHIQAYVQLAQALRTSLYLNVKALQAHRGTEHEPLLQRQFDHNLARLAQLHGRGTYENLTTRERFTVAIEVETTLFQEYQDEHDRLSEDDDQERNRLSKKATLHSQRAQTLAELLADLGYHDFTFGLPFITLYRGVYLKPLTEDVQLILRTERELFLPWHEGGIALIPDRAIAEYQNHVDEIVILYFDAHEMHDAAENMEPADFDKELQRRLADARMSGNRTIGDIFAHHINGLLVKQNIVLRSLQELLPSPHPSIATSIQSLIDENRQLIEEGLQTHPSWAVPGPSSLRQLAEIEREKQQHAQAWLSKMRENDLAGLLYKFETFIEAGTHLSDLEAAAIQLERG